MGVARRRLCQHLLHCLITRWVQRDEYIGWRETRAAAAAAREYLMRFYEDLEDGIEWEAHRSSAAPQAVPRWHASARSA